MAIKDTIKGGYDYTLKTGSDIYKAAKPYRSPSKSIIAAAKGNLFEFPVFISSTVQLDYATATTSLLEQVYASYLQAALSLNPIVDNSLVENKAHLSKFQSNTNRYLEYTEMDYAHDAVHNEYATDEGVLEFDMITIEDADGKVILEQYNKEPLSEFSHYFMEADDRYQRDLVDKYENEIRRLKMSVRAHKKRANQAETSERIATKAYNDLKQERTKDNQFGPTFAQLSRYEEELHKLDQELTEKLDAYNKDKQRFKNDKDTQKQINELRDLKNEIKDIQRDIDLENQKFEHTKEKDEADAQLRRAQFARDSKEIAYQHKKDEDERKINMYQRAGNVEILDETKLKKLNTMKPLMMNVQFLVKADNGTLSHPVNYVIGVKTFNRIIDADTLPEVVEYPLKEMNNLSRKVKWRAGELKFFRDIVFKIKQKKQTAVDSRDPKRKWYRRLYELAHTTGDAPAKAVINNKKIAWSVVKSQIENDFDFGIIPNCSLIISAGDVSNIKAKTGIDLLKGSTAKKFCKELFLITLVVVDTDAESIKILHPDEHNDYNVHSLASVNKQLAELSTAGSKTRDIFKLLG